MHSLKEGPLNDYIAKLSWVRTYISICPSFISVAVSKYLDKTEECRKDFIELIIPVLSTSLHGNQGTRNLKHLIIPYSQLKTHIHTVLPNCLYLS